MAFDNSFTAVTGATYTAAQYNTYTKGNFAALWVYTSAGDIAYASSATTLARLALGSAYRVLQVNGAGTAPIWDVFPRGARVYHSATQNVASGSPVILSFNSETFDDDNYHSSSPASRLTIPANGIYQFGAAIEYSTGGGSGNYLESLALFRNGTELIRDRRYSQVSAFAKALVVAFPPISASSGDYFEVALEQQSGTTVTVAATARFWVMRWR